ncbi:MAG: 4Fe-4S dicluster domain-containing protein [Bacteroidia bacterium]|nr:4Fe-4S dicluster domain-containing protein [Bacteroidia bacterium]
MTGKKNFGFEMLSGRQIDLDLAGNSLATELFKAVKAWNSCISCGSCTAVCPAGINFRKLHYQIRMAVETDMVETDISVSTGSGVMQVGADNYLSLQSCFMCGKCQLVCPRGIPTRYLAIQIMQKTRQYAEGIPSV